MMMMMVITRRHKAITPKLITPNLKKNTNNYCHLFISIVLIKIIQVQ